MRVKSVFVIYLQYTSKHFESAQKVMHEKVFSKFDYDRIEWITVDNSVLKDVEMTLEKNLNFISGDNSTREFSGFDKGVRYLKRFRPKHGDLIIFANDTFHRSYGDEYLDLITAEKIQYILEDRSLLGYMDSFPKTVSGFGYDFSSWIRTSFFMLNYSVLDSILPFAIQENRELVFGNSPEEFFSNQNVLSENYKSYLRTWLFETPDSTSEFRESWHSKKELNVSSFRELQQKAWCILCEQNLSAKAIKKNIKLVKMNE